MTNALDLGVWMCLPSHVERVHFGNLIDANALARSVVQTWNHSDLDKSITNVFERLKKVLLIILKNDGSIRQTEDIRGKEADALYLNNEDEVKLTTWKLGAEGDNAAIPIEASSEDDSDQEIEPALWEGLEMNI